MPAKLNMMSRLEIDIRINSRHITSCVTGGEKQSEVRAALFAVLVDTLVMLQIHARYPNQEIQVLRDDISAP